MTNRMERKSGKRGQMVKRRNGGSRNERRVEEIRRDGLRLEGEKKEMDGEKKNDK